MAAIRFVHYSLSDAGGAVAVCVTLADHFEENHDIEIYTTETPPVRKLNEMYDVSLSRDQFNVLPISILSKAWTAVSMSSLADIGTLRYTLFHILVRRQMDDPDLVVGTYSEFRSPWPSFQYIHVPVYNRQMCPGFSVENDTIANITWKIIKRLDGPRYESDDQILVTNSRWSEAQFEAAHGYCDGVIYPPVMSRGLDPDRVPWLERENGFVMAGRLAPDKQQLTCIEIVAELRDRGYNVHLHLCGPVASGSYAERVIGVAESREFVTYEGALPRAEYNSLLEEHRYGLHLKEPEHFGMVVAEMVAAGMVPFVPREGGQTDIVDNDARLILSEDPASTIESVLSDNTGESIQQSLADTIRSYSREQFLSECGHYIEPLLNR